MRGKRLYSKWILGSLLAIAVALPFPRAVADVSVCAKLLVHAETETPEIVKATLLHLLTSEHRIFLNTVLDNEMFEAAMYEMARSHPSYEWWSRTYLTSYWSKPAILGWIPDIRKGKIFNPNDVSRFSNLMWEHLIFIFSFSSGKELPESFSLPLKELINEMKPDKLAEISAILNTVNEDKRLRGHATEIVRDILLNFDELAKDVGGLGSLSFGSKKFQYNHQKKWLEKFKADINATPIPAAVPVDWKVNAERITPLSLSEIDAAFAKPGDPAALLTPKGVIHYDEKIRENVYQLSLTSVGCRDEFTELLSWPYLFDAAGKWLLEWGTTKDSAKLHFLDRLSRMRNLLDAHLRAARAHLHSTAIAEKSILIQIHDLESAVPASSGDRLEAGIAASLNDERARTKIRLESALAEVRGLNESMREWIGRLDEADSHLRDLTALAPPGGREVKDPDALRTKMKALQLSLDLDANLVERLKTKRFWLLPAR